MPFFQLDASHQQCSKLATLLLTQCFHSVSKLGPIVLTMWSLSSRKLNMFSSSILRLHNTFETNLTSPLEMRNTTMARHTKIQKNQWKFEQSLHLHIDCPSSRWWKTSNTFATRAHVKSRLQSLIAISKKCNCKLISSSNKPNTKKLFLQVDPYCWALLSHKLCKTLNPTGWVTLICCSMLELTTRFSKKKSSLW